MSKCQFHYCGSEAPQSHNYCSWQCSINEAIASGGNVITPNGLPIRCIKVNGDMLECEHGDHPDYKFPVDVDWTGERDPEEEQYGCYDETHAFLGVDETGIRTMFETGTCRFDLEGRMIIPPSWRRKPTPEDLQFQISADSMAKIRAYILANPGHPAP